MQRPQGHRCSGSHNGRPHGKDTREARRERAGERKAARLMRTAGEQIALLDRRLGKGIGAKKERERLAKIAGRKAA